MGSFFKTKKCENCGEVYEESFYACPKCDTENELVTNKRKDLRISSYKQLTLFGIGCLGFELIGLIMSILVGLFFKSVGLVGDEYRVGLSIAVNGSAYFILGAILMILSIKEIDNPFKGFKGKSLLFGLLGFGIMYGASFFNGIITSIVYNLVGIENATNANQASVSSIISNYPILAFMFVVVLGPLCEELTYRVGLFSFLRKKHVGLAIVGSALIFALIHFGYSEAFSGDYKLLIIEIMAFFSYFSAGIVLGIIYHKCGFYASLSAHVFNNLFSYVGVLLLQLIEKLEEMFK